MKSMISHVKPYEGMMETFHLNVPYANCAVMNDLVILNAYQKRELDVLCNVNFVYEFSEKINREDSNFQLKVNFFEEQERVLERLGIGIVKKAPLIEQLIDSIKDSIEHNRIILLHIDLYYQKGREYYYKKRHGIHAIIVYGYDDIKEVVYTLDNVEGYGVYEVDYETVNNYCSGLSKYLGFKLEDAYFYEYNNNKNEEAKCCVDAEILKRYCIYTLKFQEKWTESLPGIIKFKEWISENQSYKDYEETIATIKYRKASEYYRIKKLYEQGVFSNGGYKVIDEYSNVLLENWKKLQGIFMYSRLKGDYTRVRLKSASILEYIYENEQALAAIYFSEIEHYLTMGMGKR